MQEYLAAAEERLRSARLKAVLAKHQAEVEAVVSQMREGGASDLEIAVYEAEQAVEEAKIEGSVELQVRVAALHSRQLLPAGLQASACSS